MPTSTKHTVFAVVISVLSLIGSLVAIGIAVGVSNPGEKTFATTMLASDGSDNSENEPDEVEPPEDEVNNSEDSDPAENVTPEPSNEGDDSPGDNSTDDNSTPDEPDANEPASDNEEDNDVSSDSDGEAEGSQNETEDQSGTTSDDELEVELEFEQEDLFEIEDSEFPEDITVSGDEITEIEFEFEDGRFVVKVTATQDGKTITQVADAGQTEIQLVAQDGHPITITIDETGKLFLVDGQPVNAIEFKAEIKGKLSFDKTTGTILVDRGDGTLVEVTRLPSEVAQSMLEANKSVDSLENEFTLEGDGISLKYKMEGEDQVKLFGLFSFEATVKVTASADSTLVTLELPWYLSNRFVRAFISGEN